MNALATRCAHCGTSFRVSEEQLAVSDGYVRCGRCDSVFNAREALFELDGATASGSMPLSSRPAPLTPMASPEPPPAPEPEAAPEIEFQAEAELQPEPELPAEALPEPEAEREPELAPEPRWLPEATTDAAAEAGNRAEPHWDQRLEAQAAPAHAQSEAVATAPDLPLDEEEATVRMRELLGIQPSAGSTSAATNAAPAWASLDKPKRAAKSKGSRWVLGAAGLLSALLALALPLQWAWVEREALRARFPQLDAWLEPHLPSAGWRHLDGLSVGSSSLEATPQGGAYQLELELHNRATHALAMPWLDLSLSDAQGKLLLRRSLSPQELGVDTQPLPAGARRRVQTVFRVPGGTAPVAGYELGLFHP